MRLADLGMHANKLTTHCKEQCLGVRSKDLVNKCASLTSEYGSKQNKANKTTEKYRVSDWGCKGSGSFAGFQLSPLGSVGAVRLAAWLWCGVVGGGACVACGLGVGWLFVLGLAWVRRRSVCWTRWGRTAVGRPGRPGSGTGCCSAGLAGGVGAGWVRQRNRRATAWAPPRDSIGGRRGGPGWWTTLGEKLREKMM